MRALQGADRENVGLYFCCVKHIEQAIDNKLYPLYPTISDYIPSHPIISHHIPPYPTISKPGYPKDIYAARGGCVCTCTSAAWAAENPPVPIQIRRLLFLRSLPLRPRLTTRETHAVTFTEKISRDAESRHKIRNRRKDGFRQNVGKASSAKRLVWSM